VEKSVNCEWSGCNLELCGEPRQISFPVL